MLKRNRIGFAFFALALLCSLFIITGCNRQKGPDLRGAVIQIGHWWGGWDTETYQPRSEAEEQLNEWRKKIQADNGMIIREVEMAGWDAMLQDTTTRILAGNKEFSAYYLQPDWFYTVYRQGLLFPLSDSDVDITNSVPVPRQRTAYNPMMAQFFTFNGKQYGLSPGLGGGSWNGSGIYFNKRLFREAGLDPDLPYDMQRDGTWTWDNFLEICRQLTRDINNDGITDTFASGIDPQAEILTNFVFSNNADYVGRDANGRFYNATNTPNFIEALQFFRRLMDEGVLKRPPDGAAWDWYYSDFFDGRIAMMIDAEWRRGQLGEMPDDWGWVFMPKGPRATDYRMQTSEHALVIPAIFSKEEVDVILTAFDLWNTPMDLEWKADHYPFFRDRRAVDETMAMMRDSRFMSFRVHQMIPGLNTGDFAWQIMWVDGDPAQLVEQNMQVWNSLIEQANN